MWQVTGRDRCYHSSALEDWIHSKYAAAGIEDAAELTIERTARIFEVDWQLHSGESKAIWDDEYALIFIHEGLSLPEQREVFFHELCHPLKHSGNQYRLGRPFVELQEFQASRFQLYASMPYPYIRKFLCGSADDDSSLAVILARELTLPIGLVESRLNQIHGRVRQAEDVYAVAKRAQRRERDELDSRTVAIAMESPTSYGPETERLLAQLHRQLRKN